MATNIKFPEGDAPKIAFTKEKYTEELGKLTQDDVVAKKIKAYNAWNSESDSGKKSQAQWRIAALENSESLKKLKDANSALTGLKQAEVDLRAAYNTMYAAEKATKQIPPPANASADFEAAKTNWLEMRRKLQAVQAADASSQLSAGGVENLRTSINSRVSSLDGEIKRLQSRLARNSVAGADLPDMITGVTKDGDKTNLEKAKPDLGDASGPGGEDESADVWTNIAFSVSAKTDDHKQEEQGMSGSFHAEARRWWTSVKAESSFSKNDKKVSDFMASCTVSGSFSAMVVNIKRPWLHAELFQDFDIDIPNDTFLSPGAKTIKHWVDTGDTDFNGYVRTNYGKFPAYPTAFIVAADTNLSFKGNAMQAEQTLSVLQTDSSVQASFGCWGIGVSAGGK
jgi:hypothetical protein